MNDYVLAVLLGIVEGVTEFLPVSSTAHLRLTQHFLGVSLEDEYWKLFAIFIQLGAILAVMVIYRRRIAGFLKDALRAADFIRTGAAVFRHPLVLIGLAFVATAIPVFLLKKVVGQNLESLGVMVGSLAVGGVVMIAVDFLAGAGRVKSVEEMRPWQAIWIGLCQVLSAVFPGTSRSMSTIAAAQVAGLSRAAALEFSFLLAIPIMIVATLFDVIDYLKAEGSAGLSTHQIGVMAVGFVVSFVVAYGVVIWFLRFVEKHGFLWFGVYRVLAAAVLYLAMLRG